MTKEFKAVMSSLLNTEFGWILNQDDQYFKHITDDMPDNEALKMLISRAFDGGFEEGRSRWS